MIRVTARGADLDLLLMKRRPLRIQLRLTNSLTDTFMGFGEHATVIAPEALRRRVEKIGRQLVARYEGAQLVA
jgi:predicted DNA-binding transcriptional regulator YafY